VTSVAPSLMPPRPRKEEIEKEIVLPSTCDSISVAAALVVYEYVVVSPVDPSPFCCCCCFSCSCCCCIDDCCSGGVECSRRRLIVTLNNFLSFSRSGDLAVLASASELSILVWSEYNDAYMSIPISSAIMQAEGACRNGAAISFFRSSIS